MGARIDIRRYSAAEMVLLGIFALGLIWAWSLVRYRNKIRLSEPIELKLGGVSVSLPTGGGWQHWEKWQYNEKEDVNALSGHLLVGTRIGAIVQWRYMAISDSLKPEDRLSVRVGTDEVEIVEAGQIQSDVAMDWVQARLRGRLEDVFLGTARVGQGAIVELEVVTPGDAELAGRIFRVVAASLRFGADSLSDERAASRLRRVALLGANGIDREGLCRPEDGWRRI